MNNAAKRQEPWGDDFDEMLRVLAAVAPDPAERARWKRAVENVEREKAVIRARLAKLFGSEPSFGRPRMRAEPPRTHLGLVASHLFRADRSLVRGRKFMHRMRADVRVAPGETGDVPAGASGGRLARLIRLWW